MSSKPLFLQKSKSVQTRVEVTEYEGKHYVNVRDWVATKKSDGEYRPTPKGVMIPTELWATFQAIVAQVAVDASRPKSMKQTAEAITMYAAIPSTATAPRKALESAVKAKLAVVDRKKLVPSKGFVVCKLLVTGGEITKSKEYARAVKPKGEREYQWEKIE